MTREQAIKILSKDTSMETVNELANRVGFGRCEIVEIIQEAMDMGAEALEKQIPYPVKNKGDKFDMIGFCKCGELAVNWCSCLYDYCPKCGQELMWEKEGET